MLMSFFSMPKSSFQTAYHKLLMPSCILCKNSLSKKLMPKTLFQKAWLCQNSKSEVFAKTRNQFLWLQFDFFGNCDWLRMKLRCDFFYWSRFSYLHWFRNCYFRFQNLFLKWQNKIFLLKFQILNFLLKILLVQ